jgi:flagellin
MERSGSRESTRKHKSRRIQMTLTINTNIAATRASKHLASNHQNLQKSLDRLSSGKRITDASDDAGGLAVSMKLNHSINGLKGISTGISNGISVLQVMDGVLSSAGEIISRIGELKSMYEDVTKNTADKSTYNAEATALLDQITSMATNSTFNGITLFDGTGTKTVNLDIDGTSTLAITDTDFSAATNIAAMITNKTDLSNAAHDPDKISLALGEVAALRATNGGEINRLQFALEDANTQVTNMTAANGRIMDVDIAAESANLARQQILVQASAAMVAQANAANNVALTLLQ